MLTKNFYSYMRAALQGATVNFTKTDGTTNSSFLGSSSAKGPFSIMHIWAGTATSYGVSFGTGTTPADISNYCLENILGSANINVTAPSAVSFSQGDTFDQYSVSFGVTNITNEAITVSEVGLATIPTSKVYVLVDRTLLDVPVTIPPHETKHIAYTIRFNY